MATQSTHKPMLFRGIQGWWDSPGPEFYAARVNEAGPQAHFVEVGCWRGRSAASMAEMIKMSGKLIRFDCVDTWRGTPKDGDGGTHQRLIAEEKLDLRSEFEANLRRLGLWRYVNPVTGDSGNTANEYEDNSLEFVFIDADHRREMVSRDVLAWLPKVKLGGVIGGHDWTNHNIRQGVQDAMPQGSINSEGMIWWTRRGAAMPESEVDVIYPSVFVGVSQAHRYLLKGLSQVARNVSVNADIVAKGYWSPPGRRGRDPIHVAVLFINNRVVCYDVSDFVEITLDRPKLFKVQVLREDVKSGKAIAIGQYLTREIPECLLNTRCPKEHTATACFSNIDEHNNPPLRRRLVERLYALPDSVVGLWRFSCNRPPVPTRVEGAPVSHREHMNRIARSKIAFALPGVGGDFTRQHVEIMALGTCLVTVETAQEWPGNWQGCWREMKRDLSDLDKALETLLVDEEERERLGRLGHWYYETNLRPDKMASRLIRRST